MTKAEKCHRWRTKRTGLGTAVGYLREYEQKKAETARESVTRLMMVLVQERKRDTAHDGVGLSGGSGSHRCDAGRKIARFVLWANFFVSDYLFGKDGTFMHCSGGAFFVAQNTLNTELRSRWQRLRSATGGGRSKQGLAQRSAFCENTSRKRREPQVEA